MSKSFFIFYNSIYFSNVYTMCCSLVNLILQITY